MDRWITIDQKYDINYMVLGKKKQNKKKTTRKESTKKAKSQNLWDYLPFHTGAIDWDRTIFGMCELIRYSDGEHMICHYVSKQQNFYAKKCKM